MHAWVYPCLRSLAMQAFERHIYVHTIAIAKKLYEITKWNKIITVFKQFY